MPKRKQFVRVKTFELPADCLASRAKKVKKRKHVHVLAEFKPFVILIIFKKILFPVTLCFLGSVMVSNLS